MIETTTEHRGAGRISRVAIAYAALACVGAAAAGSACADVERSSGATVYVPVYSQVWQGPRERPFRIATSASVRNTDAERTMTLVRVDYYDSEGKKIRAFIKRPVELGPLAAREFRVGQPDHDAGSGASFIIEWKAESAVTVPVIEGLMIGTAWSQGISFTSRGQVIK